MLTDNDTVWKVMIFLMVLIVNLSKRWFDRNDRKAKEWEEDMNVEFEKMDNILKRRYE